MKLDMVHDIQRVYRKVVDCMSKPGHINNICEEASRIDLDIDFYNSTVVLMLMLLDPEVSFKIFSINEDKITKLVNQLTYAKAETVENANFIFVLRDTEEANIGKAFERGYEGSLIDPHSSATIIIESGSITKDKDLILSGPGIKDKNYVTIDLPHNWIEKRSLKNTEYPLGVDTIIVDGDSNLLCLPRTTEISKQVVK